MTRELTSHKVNDLNEALKIQVLDEPGSGGACHKYTITTPNKPLKQELSSPAVNVEIDFQNGPIAEAGVNGISQESLLAIVEDRLLGFASGPYATNDNAEALGHVRQAMECLHRRTRERVQRGVEGTSAK